MKKIVLGTLGLLVSYTTCAQAGQIHFSAEAVMKLPNATQHVGQIYVGNAGTRFDYTENGQKVSKVDLPKQGLVRILFPAKKEYLEFKMPAGKGSVGQSSQPCQQTAQTACKKVADEDFNGMKVERWTVSPKQAAKPIHILWDKSRKMMVSQVFPNGVSITNRLIAKEKYENVDAERWETAYKTPDGKVQKGTVIYAPELSVSVSEKQPDGMVKELHKIKISEPNNALFDLPEGYKKITQPASTGSVQK